jgi:AcrR family transcriptional regulator
MAGGEEELGSAAWQAPGLISLCGNSNYAILSPESMSQMPLLKPVPINAPKQDRSRASFERVLDASVELLKEQGYEGFTLQEVSKRSKTSIGSIYCRVKGKDELFRAVQVHVLERRGAEMEIILDPAKWEGLEPAKLLHFLVREVGEYLRRHGSILRAFVAHERRDPVIFQTGKQAHFRMAQRFQSLLMLHSAEFTHPKPEQAVAFCFNLTFSMVARHLDLDTITPSMDGTNWNQLLDDLGHILCLYLLGADTAAQAGAEIPETAGATAGTANVGGRKRTSKALSA